MANSRPVDDYFNGYEGLTGKEGEKIVNKYLKRANYKVEWYNGNSEEHLRKQQKEGIDFTINDTITIDAKVDTYLGKTGNILFEINSYSFVYRKYVAAWGTHSKADIIIFIAPYLKQLFLINLEDFRKRVKWYNSEKGTPETNSCKPKDEAKITYFKLYPISYFNDLITTTPY